MSLISKEDLTLLVQDWKDEGKITGAAASLIYSLHRHADDAEKRAREWVENEDAQAAEVRKLRAALAEVIEADDVMGYAAEVAKAALAAAGGRGPEGE